MSIKSKRIFVIFLLAGLLTILKGVSADAYVGSIFTYTYENQTISYKVLSEPTVTENGTAEVIYWDGVNQNLTGEVVIPPTVTNQKMTYNVTRIGGDAFADAAGITSLKLPDKIVFIGADAFRGCSNLASVNIPVGVTAIENSTFSGCSSLVSIALPDKITYIGSNAFTDCSKLTGINLPKNIKKIGSGAFSGCSSLTSVNIPEGITSIENNLFQDCINLTRVSLPESITSIGSKAFYNCSSLKDVHLSDEITSIGEYAFYNCSSLTSIKIPYKVTRIENRTFLLCSNLTKIRIQNKVTSIGDFAFYGCSSLINVTLPDSVTSIGDFAFTGCESLRPLRIPESVESIGKGDFPYTGVLVYKNSFAETFFKKQHPDYYQIIKIPLEEMFFAEEVKRIDINALIRLNPIYYPANASEITGKVIWSSSDSQVVSVDGDGTIKGVTAGEAYITAAMGNYVATCKIIVGGEVVNPASIHFTSSRQNMIKGDSTRLSINFTPTEATNRAVTWTSSDNSVVIVDNGRIYAKNSGTATITAVSATGTAECNITVYNPLKEVYSDYNEITINTGEKKKIGISYDPMDTTDDKNISWSIEDSSIASIENGVITAVKPGITKVTAAIGAFTHSIQVRILAPVKSISFTQNSVALTAGQSREVPLAIEPKETTDEIIITSSDETVATYSDGTIIAKGRGRAIITATSGSLSTTCMVTVGTDIKSIAINKKSLTLNLGESSSLTVTYNPVKPADDKTIIWTSSDETVAKVDGKGKVIPVGTGKATITAIVAGDKKAVSTVTVKLSVPTTVKAVSTGHNKVKISWKEVSGASGYEVYRALSKAGTYKKIKDTKAKTFTNTGLTAGTTYYYKVRAYRYKSTKKVYGSFSVIVNGKPIPSAPAKVKLVKTGAGRIAFTWNKVDGAYGYEIYRTSSKKAPFKRVKDTTTYHYINYGLTKGKTYYYKVRAYKVVGAKKVYSKYSKTFTIKM